MKALICSCSTGIYSHLIGTTIDVSYFNNNKLMIAGDTSKNIMLFNKVDVIILQE